MFRKSKITAIPPECIHIADLGIKLAEERSKMDYAVRQIHRAIITIPYLIGFNREEAEKRAEDWRGKLDKHMANYESLRFEYNNYVRANREIIKAHDPDMGFERTAHAREFLPGFIERA